jgi:hypothetical protein
VNLSQLSLQEIQQLPASTRILSSVTTLARGDAGAYYSVEEKTAGQISLRCEESVSIRGVGGESYPESLTLPATLKEPFAEATANGIRLLLPVSDENGRIKGVIAVDRIQYQKEDGNWVHPWEGLEWPVRDPSVHSASVAMAETVIGNFADWLPPAKISVEQMAEKFATYPQREEFLRKLAEPMYAYFGEGSEIAQHVKRVADLTLYFADELRHSPQPRVSSFLPMEGREYHHLLVQLHDIGKVYGDTDTLRYQPAFLLNEEQRNLNRMHPFYTYLALNLPGFEQDALQVANHHLDGRPPFDTLPAAEVTPFSAAISICDKFEAMTGKRVAATLNGNGSLSAQKALLSLGRTAIEGVRNIPLAMMRAFAGGKAWERFATENDIPFATEGDNVQNPAEANFPQTVPHLLQLLDHRLMFPVERTEIALTQPFATIRAAFRR